MFCFINHVHHFLDALLMLRYLHWVQISFILSCSTLFFSIVYHLHKMYVSGISFFQNLERWLGNLVLQYDAPPFFFAFLLKFDHITHGSPEKFKQRDVCVYTYIWLYVICYKELPPAIMESEKSKYALLPGRWRLGEPMVWLQSEGLQVKTQISWCCRWSLKAICWGSPSCSGRLDFLFHSGLQLIGWGSPVVCRAISFLKVNSYNC